MSPAGDAPRVSPFVAAERRALTRLTATGGAARALACIAAGLALTALVLGGGRWIALPRWLPLVVAVVLAACVASLALLTARELRRSRDDGKLARAGERAAGLRDGALVAALELEGRGPLAAKGVADTRAALARHQGALAPELRGAARRSSLRWAIALGVAALLLVGVAPSHGDGLRAVVSPMSAWRGELLTRPEVVGAPAVVARGRTFEVELRAPGRRSLRLRERETGAAWRERTVELGAAGEAKVSLGPIAGDMHLLATDGRATSSEVVVRAVDRPYLGDVRVRVVTPRYLGAEAMAVPEGDVVRAPRGSTIEVSAGASVALSEARLVAADDTVALANAGRAARGVIPADRSRRWEWVASAAGEPSLDVPPPLEVEVVADSAPSIGIDSPLADTIVLADPTVTLRIVAADDHGLAQVALRIAKQGAAASRELARSLPSRWAAEVTLDAQQLELGPGTSASVVAEATDNSPWAQSARSRALVLRVPGFAEQRELARAAADSLVRAAASTAAEQRELARRTGEAARDRGARQQSGARQAPSGDQMSYERAQQMREMRQEQDRLTSSVKELRDKAKSLERQLDRAGALDSSLATQLADAQRLLQEAMTPELAKAMAELDSALASRSSDRTRESLGDLAREQEKLRQQLERVAEMLNRAALEGSMETLRDEASDVAHQERALADSMGRSTDAAERRKARELGDRSEKLAKDVRSLEDRLRKAGGEPGAQAAKRAATEAAQSSRNMRAGTPEQAGEGAQAMERAAEALAEARKGQIDAWKQELSGELDRAIQEMLQLASDERALEDKSRSGTPSGELRAEQGAVQAGTERTSERLEKAARASSLLSGRARRAVSEARRETSRATEETARQPGRASPGATDAMGSAADALTRAAAALVRDRERVNSSATATGFAEMMREMQELAKKQGGLNAQASGLFQMPSPQAARDGAKGIAREQRAVARALDELGDADGSGRAEALATEARRLAEALERGDISEATRQRQERLLRRMLDAGRSLEGEEREEGKRESRSASGSDVFAPGQDPVRGAAGSRVAEPRWEDLRGLSAEERRAVIDYFRRLNGSQQR
ncbi:MAG TPA: hypothetical protein VHM67_14195 [Gemmatimonadaceae bacterium]|nr:hypothetical protein [Gemmatimonadaceae bacterium]